MTLIIDDLHFRYRYHELLVLGAQFIAHLFDFRRGVEGIAYLPGDAWELMELNDGDVKIKAFVKVVSEASKNHQKDSEDPSDFGIIPNMEMPGGTFNPAKFYQFYMKSRNPKQMRLFQKAQRVAPWFDIDNFAIKVLFEDGKIGKNQIRTMLKMLCEITGQPKFTNHSLRATGICILKSYGFDDRTIAKLTGKYKFSIYVLKLLAFMFVF